MILHFMIIDVYDFTLDNVDVYDDHSQYYDYINKY